MCEHAGVDGILCNTLAIVECKAVNVLYSVCLCRGRQLLLHGISYMYM